MTWRLCTDPWTRTEKPILMRKWAVSLGFHSFKLTPPRRAPASQSFWTDYTELSEMLAINAQVVSRQPSLKALTHQTVIIWKGQRWVKLLTQSASHANACCEPNKFDGFSGHQTHKVPQKSFPLTELRGSVFIAHHFVYLCDDALWCTLVFIAHTQHWGFQNVVLGLEGKTPSKTTIFKLFLYCKQKMALLCQYWTQLDD